MPKYQMGRYINGISLNGLEYVMDGPPPGGKTKEFDSVQEALDFLNRIGDDDEVVSSKLEAYDIYGVEIEEIDNDR